jgi:hypothetical protein
MTTGKCPATVRGGTSRTGIVVGLTTTAPSSRATSKSGLTWSRKSMSEIASNYDVALKAEMKRVVRCFQSYTSNQRADNAANFRMGYQQRRAIGEFFYTHPDVPNLAFPKRKLAAAHALRFGS